MIIALIGLACSVVFFALGWWWRGQVDGTRLTYWAALTAGISPEQIKIFAEEKP